MKKNFILSSVILCSLFLASCQAIGDIFKTGVGVGVFIVVAVIVVILLIVRGGSKK